MRGLAYFCFLSAAAYALAGMALGIFMAASQDHTFATAHAHLNLLGWVSLGLIGLYYHQVPEAAASGLARIQASLATLGLWLLIPGIAMAHLGMSEGPAVAGSLVTILSMALFVLIVARTRRTEGA